MLLDWIPTLSSTIMGTSARSPLCVSKLANGLPTMTQLRINLLGAFQIWANDEPVTVLTSPKIQALLAYLTVEPIRMHSRDSLSSLLWPDFSMQKARQNLRQSLSRLLKALPLSEADPPLLNITRQEIGINVASRYTLDFALFTAALDGCRTHAHDDLSHCLVCCEQLSAAVPCYQGDFLAGVYAESLPFDEWALLKREWLRREALAALGVLVRHSLWRGEYETAYQHAWRQIEIDPLHEEAHRSVMQALTLDGRTREALAQYAQLCQLLMSELGANPDEETTALYESIRSGTYPQGSSTKAEATPVPSRRYQPYSPPAVERSWLPPQFTPFVGREDELAQIGEQLMHPNCHLLTLIGPGGVGKTRLALESAQRQLGCTIDRIHFVPLAAVSSAAQLVAAVAHAVGFTLPLGAYSLEAQQDALARYLRTQSLLLVLDNYEQLLPQVDLITTLLQNAPDLTLLVTSRAPLNLRAEWIIEIDGLPIPPLSGPSRPLREYAAVQLFAQSVERTNPAALRSDLVAPAITRICHLVHGMPLALELAAARVRTLPVDDVADAIAADLDFLSTSMRDVPERHRSLRAVIDQSWRLLTAQEQRLFASLSVFRATFDQKAAQATTTFAEEGLDRLVAHSLLRRAEEDRYQLHETLRQYANQKLAEQPDLAEEVMLRFATYFLHRLSAYEHDLNGNDVLGAQTALYADLDNLRVAWQWAIEQDRADLIRRSANSLFRFYNGVGLMQEGENTFESAIAHFRTTAEPVTTALLLCKLSRLRNSRGRFEPAAAAAQEAVDLLDAARSGAPAHRPQDSDALQVEAEAWQQWGRSMLHLGRFDEADAHLEQAMTLVAQLDEEAPAKAGLEAEIHFNLGTIANFQSNYKVAHAQDMEALRLSRRSGDRHLEAISLNNLGSVADLSGRVDDAISYFEQALEIFEDVAYRRGIANCLSNIGAMVSWRGELADALERHRDAQRVYQEIGDIGGEGWSLMALGSILFHQGQLDEARRSLQQALALNREGTLSMDTWASYHMAQVALGQGQLDEARLWIEQSFDLADSMGDEMSAADAEMLWGQIDLRIGNLRRAQERFEHVLNIKQKYTHAQGEVGARVALAVVAQLQADLGTALAHVEAALVVPNTAHLLLAYAPAVTLQGRLLAEMGDRQAADSILQAALEMRRHIAQPHHVAEIQAVQARLFLAEGQRDAARRAAEALLDPLCNGSIDGVDDPIDVYVNVATVLAATGDPGDPRRRDLLRVAQARLRHEADSLADPEHRAAFLVALPSHRALAELLKQHALDRR